MEGRGKDCFEALGRDANLRHFAMLEGANKGGALGGLDGEVKDNTVKGRVRSVAMAFPVAGAGIKLDRTLQVLAIENDGAV